MVDLSVLRSPADVWKEWRFEPWEGLGVSGLYRRASFIKAGLLGEIARYYADDYVVLVHDEGALDRVLQAAVPQEDLMVQRWLFVQPQGEFFCKKRGFIWGFKGFFEGYRYTPLGRGTKKVRDLTQLVDRAHLMVQKGSDFLSV